MIETLSSLEVGVIAAVVVGELNGVGVSERGGSGEVGEAVVVMDGLGLDVEVPLVLGPVVARG